MSPGVASSLGCPTLHLPPRALLNISAQRTFVEVDAQRHGSFQQPKHPEREDPRPLLFPGPAGFATEQNPPAKRRQAGFPVLPAICGPENHTRDAARGQVKHVG